MTIEARIEYVTTEDGVSLACTKFGSGPAVVYQFANPGSSHFEMEFAFPPAVATYEEFARIATVIRYDPRNTGLSTRGVEDVSVDAQLRDLDAVRVHFGFESVSLMFPFTWAGIAVEYASARPDRVTSLVLPYPMFSLGRRLINSGPVDDIMSAARAAGPELYATISAVMFVGLEAHANAAWLARYSVEGSDWDDRLRGDAAVATHDANAAAARVQAPTLIIQRKLPQFNAGPTSADMIREHKARITRTSALIPGAETAMFEGSSLWYSGEEDITARSVDFLRKVFASVAQPSSIAYGKTQPMAPIGGFRTVLVTDIVAHTDMMQRLGDAKGRDVLREHERITRDLLKTHGGAEIKTMGDGFMASFSSVTSALDCAIALQRAFAAFELPSPLEGEGLGVRAGLNAGEPIEEDGDLFGATVILASRIAAKAGPGEILIPEPVRHLLSGKAFSFADRGDFIPKGFDDAVRLFEVHWRQ